MTRSKRLPSSTIRASSALACGTVRGKPSMMKPGSQSGCRRRLRIMPIMMSSETYWPAARMGWALSPSSVPFAISARSMSPVAICGIRKYARSTLACVPLPEPGAPYSKRFTPYPSPLPMNGKGPSSFSALSLDESPVLTHHKLGLELLHRVERDADHDQDGGASEVHLLLVDSRDPGRGDRQDHRDEAEEDRADEGDAVHHRLQVVGRRPSGANAWDEARV